MKALLALIVPLLTMVGDMAFPGAGCGCGGNEREYWGCQSDEQCEEGFLCVNTYCVTGVLPEDVLHNDSDSGGCYDRRMDRPHEASDGTTRGDILPEEDSLDSEAPGDDIEDGPADSEAPGDDTEDGQADRQAPSDDIEDGQADRQAPGDAPADGELPRSCCASDESCSEGERCWRGWCLPPVAPPQCYDDGDCDDSHMVCEIPDCPCGEAGCEPPALPGECRCDGGCAADFPCSVLLWDIPGATENMEPPFCWNGSALLTAMEDVPCEVICETECCMGAGCDMHTVPCAEGCGILPGAGEHACVNCCTADEGCPEGMVCVCPEPLDQGCQGVCQRAPEPGECWDDGDCFLGQTCQGANRTSCDGNPHWGNVPALGTCRGDTDLCGPESWQDGIPLRQDNRCCEQDINPQCCHGLCNEACQLVPCTEAYDCGTNDWCCGCEYRCQSVDSLGASCQKACLEVCIDATCCFEGGCATEDEDQCLLVYWHL